MFKTLVQVLNDQAKESQNAHHRATRKR